jgi:hypothetical protein
LRDRADEILGAVGVGIGDETGNEVANANVVTGIRDQHRGLVNRCHCLDRGALRVSVPHSPSRDRRAYDEENPISTARPRLRAFLSRGARRKPA